jgi:AcrR family transcriptional regulator
VWMASKIDATPPPRLPLSKQRVLDAAVALADTRGVEALSMRNLAQELGVVPMALYKHVANKDDLLDGMIDVVVGEIDPPPPQRGTDWDWKAAIRQRVLSARRALLRHPWASRVIETRTQPTPAVLGYMDSMIGMFRAGGLSIDLTHHAMHAMGSRLLGFSQELFDDTADDTADPDGDLDAEQAADRLRELDGTYPNITELVRAITHDQASVVGQGCDDQFEFEFALDLLLDGLQRLRDTA